MFWEAHANPTHKFYHPLQSQIPMEFSNKTNPFNSYYNHLDRIKKENAKTKHNIQLRDPKISSIATNGLKS